MLGADPGARHLSQVARTPDTQIRTKFNVFLHFYDGRIRENRPLASFAGEKNERTREEITLTGIVNR